MLTLLKKVKTKARRFKLSKATKNVLLVVLSLLILDALVAVLGAPYLSKNIGTFIGKSNMGILSDLLFLEGAVIFAIGTFIAVLRFMQEREPLYRSSTETPNNEGQTREKRTDASILMIIIGAILVGLSITIGTLLL